MMMLETLRGQFGPRISSIALKKQPKEVQDFVLQNCQPDGRSYSLVGVLNAATPVDRDPITQATPVPENEKTSTMTIMKNSMKSGVMGFESTIPTKDANFVPFGCFGNLNKIIKSKVFTAVYIVGDSGNGKTKGVEQSCARNNRALEKISIDDQTAYNELVATIQLTDGDTEVHYGVVSRAMKNGSVLLLDELDRGNARNLMCIQEVLNGGSLTIKETGEVIQPAPGFVIIATGNTKGRADDTGRFIASEILDEAFLERLRITLEQTYPVKSIEVRIINNILSSAGVDYKKEWVDHLVLWAQSTRETYDNGGDIENFITTRRLTHVAENYKIFGDEKLAVELAVSRFDASAKDAFMDLYNALDGSSSDTEVV